MRCDKPRGGSRKAVYRGLVRRAVLYFVQKRIGIAGVRTLEQIQMKHTAGTHFWLLENMPFPSLMLASHAEAISDISVTSPAGFSAITQDQHSIPVEMDVWVKASNGRATR